MSALDYALKLWIESLDLQIDLSDLRKKTMFNSPNYQRLSRLYDRAIARTKRRRLMNKFLTGHKEAA